MKSGWIIGLGVFVAGAVLSETVLIDADTNNGSFEEAMGGAQPDKNNLVFWTNSLAEVAIKRELFHAILKIIDRLRWLPQVT